LDSAQIRDELLRILKLDLVGPSSGDAREEEILDRAPSREYLTGFLIPFEPPSGHVKPEVATDETAGEQIDLFSNKAATDDDQTPEGGSARRAWFPSSMGISVLIPKETSSITATVEWGEYKKVEEKEGAGNGRGAPREQWKRKQRCQQVLLKIGAPTEKPQSVDVSDSGGLKLMTSVRKIPPSDEPGGIPAELVPAGARSVSVFLVNYRRPQPDPLRDQAYIFQPRLILSTEASFVPRPNLRGLVASTDDRDEQIADLQYRDCYEYAVGHGVSTSATLGADGTCREVRTEWVPTSAVEKVEAGEVKDVESGMEALAAISEAATMRARLAGLPAQYAK
jgi:hypothetical protein